MDPVEHPHEQSRAGDQTAETADIIGLGAGTIKWPSKLIGKTAGGIRYRAAAGPNGANVRFKVNGADCASSQKD